MRLPRLPSQSHNLSTLRASPLSELAGSLGDLGTLLPLLIALTLTKSINLSTTLVATGLSNILTGLFFSIPLPVQPMKAIAAVAIAQSFTVEQTVSAGLFVAGTVGFLSATRLLDLVGRLVPVPVVKGIQIGAGLNLVISAGGILVPLGWTGPFRNEDGWILAIVAFLGLVLAATQPRVPYALVVFGIGMAFSGIHNARSGLPAPFALWAPRVVHLSGADVLKGVTQAGLGQLPLTILNSIIAVTHLSAELLPSQPAPTPTSLGLSIFAMNALGCAFGAMPTCHGSGGLAGQFRFGARSGASIVLLGSVKLFLGLFFAEDWLLALLQRFPKALLGIMVIAAGVELAKVGESLNTGARDLWEDAAEGRKVRHVSDEERRERWSVMLVTVAGMLAFKNDAVGFLAGLAWHVGLKAPGWWEARRRGHEVEEEERLLG